MGEEGRKLPIHIQRFWGLLKGSQAEDMAWLNIVSEKQASGQTSSLTHWFKWG